MTIPLKLLLVGLVKTSLSQDLKFGKGPDLKFGKGAENFDSLETDFIMDTMDLPEIEIEDLNSAETTFNKSEIMYSYHPSIARFNFGGDEVFGEEQKEFYLHANETDMAPGLRAGVEFFKNGHGIAIAIPEMLRLHICWHIVWAHKNPPSNRQMAHCQWKLHHIQAALRNYGCNCFPSNFDFDKRSLCKKWNCMQWTMGKNGKPIDKIDRECAHLRDRIKCLELDAEQGGIEHPAGPDAILVEERCSRWTTFPYFFSNGELFCGTAENPNYENGVEMNEECEFAMCQMVKLFVMNSWKHMVIGEWMSGGARSTDFVKVSKLLYNINQDPDYCDRGIASRSDLDISSTECCGEHPFRRSYRPIVKDCCPTGEVANFGECPF